MENFITYTPYTFKQINGRDWTDAIYKGVDGAKLYRADYQKLQDANTDRRKRYDEMRLERTKESSEKLAESLKKDQEENKDKCGNFDFKCHLDKVKGFFKDAALNLAFGVGIALVGYFLFKKYSR